MIFAAEENQDPADLGISVDQNVIAKAQVRYDDAVKFGAVTIGARIHGTEHLDVEYRALRKSVERIRRVVTKTSLQMER
jgi:hypothetical protein